MSAEVLLQVTKINKSFGGVKAVQDVDLELPGGEILGVIGPNGSGKTTLVNLITGFVKPDSGEVLFKKKEDHGITAPSDCRPWSNPDLSDHEALS